MRPGDDSFRGINFHGLAVKWEQFDKEADLWEPRIELPDVTIRFHNTPFYMDRGRWQFWPEVTAEKREKVHIDWCDCFPRYLFSLQAAVDEMYQWVLFRKLLPKPKDDATH